MFAKFEEENLHKDIVKTTFVLKVLTHLLPLTLLIAIHSANGQDLRERKFSKHTWRIETTLNNQFPDSDASAAKLEIRRNGCQRVTQIFFSSNELDLTDSLTALNGTTGADSPFLKCLKLEDLAVLEERLRLNLLKNKFNLKKPTIDFAPETEGKLIVGLKTIHVNEISVKENNITETYKINDSVSPDSITNLEKLATSILLSNLDDYELKIVVDSTWNEAKVLLSQERK